MNANLLQANTNISPPLPVVSKLLQEARMQIQHVSLLVGLQVKQALHQQISMSVSRMLIKCLGTLAHKLGSGLVTCLDQYVGNA